MSKEPEYLPEHHEQPDEWHAHAPDEGLPQSEHASRVNTTMLAAAFLVIVASVVFVAVVVTVYFNSYAATLRAEKVETLTWAEESFEMKSAMQAVLEEGGEAPGGVRYEPIGEAMDQVIRAYEDTRADAN